ncbi:hypothetical protein B0H13DRAFT_1932062 [Mycena leptocephala]|nr:hypothetical protein B0H13DRAFT_1932062 [Mycena leptocephala]
MHDGRKCGQVAAAAASQMCTDLTALQLAHEEEGDLCSFHGERTAAARRQRRRPCANAKNAENPKREARKGHRAERRLYVRTPGMREGSACPQVTRARVRLIDDDDEEVGGSVQLPRRDERCGR